MNLFAAGRAHHFWWSSFPRKRANRTWGTYSILEAKQHNLQLADSSAVKVELQLEPRQCVGDDLPVCHANKVSQADYEGGDVLDLQPCLLGALRSRRHKAEVYNNEWGLCI